MAKFKVGDRVRVLDGSKIEGYTGDWVPKMEKYVGNVYAVTRILSNSAYCLKGILFMFDERGLERVGNPGKIVITIKKINDFGFCCYAMWSGLTGWKGWNKNAR